MLCVRFELGCVESDHHAFHVHAVRACCVCVCVLCARALVGKALSTWTINHADEWCRQMPHDFIITMVKKSLRAGMRLKRRSDSREKAARKEVITHEVTHDIHTHSSLSCVCSVCHMTTQ